MLQNISRTIRIIPVEKDSHLRKKNCYYFSYKRKIGEGVAKEKPLEYLKTRNSVGKISNKDILDEFERVRVKIDGNRVMEKGQRNNFDNILSYP